MHVTYHVQYKYADSSMYYLFLKMQFTTKASEWMFTAKFTKLICNKVHVYTNKASVWMFPAKFTKLICNKVHVSTNKASVWMFSA